MNIFLDRLLNKRSRKSILPTFLLKRLSFKKPTGMLFRTPTTYLGHEGFLSLHIQAIDGLSICWIVTIVKKNAGLLFFICMLKILIVAVLQFFLL